MTESQRIEQCYQDIQTDIDHGLIDELTARLYKVYLSMYSDGLYTLRELGEIYF
jgi:hypothetical protein